MLRHSAALLRIGADAIDRMKGEFSEDPEKMDDFNEDAEQMRKSAHRLEAIVRPMSAEYRRRER